LNWIIKKIFKNNFYKKYMETIENNKKNFQKAVLYYEEELKKIRTGRASSALVEDILVDYYGGKTSLKQIASITIPEPRMIAIAPWNRDDLISIEKCIRESQLNFNPINDGQLVRINIPDLTEERRRELVKTLNQKTEDTRVSVRRIREDIWNEIQKREDEGQISQDEKFSDKEKLQKIVDEYNQQIEKIRSKKEEEIMTI